MRSSKLLANEFQALPIGLFWLYVNYILPTYIMPYALTLLVLGLLILALTLGLKSSQAFQSGLPSLSSHCKA
jgi:hypothetical protein